VTAQQVTLRQAASDDIDEAVEHYFAKGDEPLGLRFVEAMERALAEIARYPNCGSPRFAHELNLPGLRCLKAGRFPYLVFYLTAADDIYVWRVLHERRNFPDWLHTEEG
jgi:toxin ParE1/3/4